MSKTVKSVTILALLWLSACGSNAVKTHYYTLQPSSELGQVNKLSFNESLGVGPVSLPEFLDRMPVVSVSTDNQIIYSPDHLWAGDLKRSIVRVLSNDIAILADKDSVWSFPWEARSRPEYQIAIDVERFSGALGGRVEMDVKWILYSEKGRTLVAVNRKTFSLDTRSTSYQSYVDTLNTLLHQLAQAITESFTGSMASGGE